MTTESGVLRALARARPALDFEPRGDHFRAVSRATRDEVARVVVVEEVSDVEVARWRALGLARGAPIEIYVPRRSVAAAKAAVLRARIAAAVFGYAPAEHSEASGRAGPAAPPDEGGASADAPGVRRIRRRSTSASVLKTS